MYVESDSPQFLQASTSELINYVHGRLSCIAGKDYLYLCKNRDQMAEGDIDSLYSRHSKRSATRDQIRPQ